MAEEKKEVQGKVANGKKRVAVPREKPMNNALIGEMQKKGFTFLGKRFSDCGSPLTITKTIFYDIQNMNTEAQSAKDLIATMVGKLGIRFITKGKKITEDRTWEKKILGMFTDPIANTFQITKDKFYTHHFCSGEVNAYLATMQDGSTRVQILDSRYIQRKYDKLGNLTKVLYDQDELVLSNYRYIITKFNTENPYEGKSSYETVVFDALSDTEASKRNFYFFRNNAMPNLILTMEDEITNPDEVKAAISRFEESYRGSENSNKVMASGGIKEVKTIDFTNKDLDLLELKKFSIKQFGMVFRIDPRFLGYRDGENGSHSEYDKMASQSDKSMVSYADHLETFMMQVITSLYPLFPYSGIMLDSDRFMDEEAKQTMFTKMVQNGLITPKAAMEELGYDVSNLPDYLDTYYMNIQYDTIENIMAKSKATIEATNAKSTESKKTGAEPAKVPAKKEK